MLNVFLTDDDEDDRLFFKEAIEKVNVDAKLDLFNDGEELMQHLNQKNIKLPDLIFLDLNMPFKNGMECLQEIKASDKLKDIVIAIYSTSLSDRDIEDTFIKGANIYINKPTSFKALQEAISKVLKLNWQYQTSKLNRDNFLFKI